jgi:integrase
MSANVREREGLYEIILGHKVDHAGGLPSPDDLARVVDALHGVTEHLTHEIGRAVALVGVTGEPNTVTFEQIGRLLVWADYVKQLAASLVHDAAIVAVVAHESYEMASGNRQVLEQAVTLGLLETNPCARIRNRRVKLDEDREIRPFASWDDLEAIGDELDQRMPLPIFLAGTGMRPEEAFALEWRDVDKANGAASVERVHSQGRTKACMKSDRQRRRVPLRAKVLEVLDGHPRRLDTRLVFPSRDGGYLKLPTFRLRH